MLRIDLSTVKTRWSDTPTLEGHGKGSDYEVLMLHLDLRVVRLSSINIPARSEREIVMCWHPGQVWIESIYQGLIF